jgi:hypothetical protein
MTTGSEYVVSTSTGWPGQVSTKQPARKSVVSVAHGLTLPAAEEDSAGRGGSVRGDQDWSSASSVGGPGEDCARAPHTMARHGDRGQGGRERRRWPATCVLHGRHRWGRVAARAFARATRTHEDSRRGEVCARQPVQCSIPVVLLDISSRMHISEWTRRSLISAAACTQCGEEEEEVRPHMAAEISWRRWR